MLVTVPIIKKINKTPFFFTKVHNIVENDI